MKDDAIRRQDAIDALWKALYEYEDKTEKQFQESEDLDVRDWIVHRGFVQNMSDIDRHTILNLPSAQPEPKKGTWVGVDDEPYDDWECDRCGEIVTDCGWDVLPNFCPNCGADMKGGEDETD